MGASMIELVGFDLDGTLVGRDLHVRPAVRQAIDAMHGLGVRGCIVTGRMYRAAKPFAKALGFDAPVICYQGAVVVDVATDRPLVEQPLGAEIVAALAERAHERGWHLQLYRDDAYFCERASVFSAHYAKLAGVEPVIVDSLCEAFAGQAATKALVIAEPIDAQTCEEELRSVFGDRAYVTRSYPEFVEILNPLVNKGLAFVEVARRLGIDLRRTLAIGDAWNDEPLLRAAGIGVAMGSAPAGLREMADAVVNDVEGDGVAQALERFVLSAQ